MAAIHASTAVGVHFVWPEFRGAPIGNDVITRSPLKMLPAGYSGTVTTLCQQTKVRSWFSRKGLEHRLHSVD
jgi:hypothetical protein